MKLALITAPKGFYLLDLHRLSYHLVLAQYASEGSRYAEFYAERHRRGDFILLDNGAAENGTVSIDELVLTAQRVCADEIVLPDVLFESQATIDASMSPEVLAAIPPVKRAVCPQGNSLDEWLTCANAFVDSLEFVTLCVPKHLERFQGGRVQILNTIEKLGWHYYYNIHLLGIWGDPWNEVVELRNAAPWARGIDTAAPIALAQQGFRLENVKLAHVSHEWEATFTRTMASTNIRTMLNLLGAK